MDRHRLVLDAFAESIAIATDALRRMGSPSADDRVSARDAFRGELNRQSELTTRFRLDCLDIRSEWAEARACRSQERFPL